MADNLRILAEVASRMQQSQQSQQSQQQQSDGLTLLKQAYGEEPPFPLLQMRLRLKKLAKSYPQFAKLPRPANFVDGSTACDAYYRMIQSPISLKCIESKLSTYKNNAALLRDVDLLVANCAKYNAGPGGDISRAQSCRIQREIREFLKNLP